MKRCPIAALSLAFLLSLSALVPAPARSQTMEEVLQGLFVFGSGSDPLFLAGSAGQPETEVHGDHYIPSAAESNGNLLGVFNTAIASNIANFPLSSTVASQTFSFVGGVPTPTSNSFGPIFAERAQTLGRGRFDVGMSYSNIGFQKIRGIPMDALELNFVHQNVDFPNCDTIFEGDCTLMGVPSFEHDVIRLDLDLAVDAKVYAFNATFGVTDWLDVGVAVPIVSIEIDGSSTASIQPAVVDNVAHFFGGSTDEPVLSASTASRGSASGIGDAAGRLKARLLDGDYMDVAVLGEVRLPTGREEDFLGTGEVWARGSFISSATLGDFGPHVNFGYLHRGGEGAPDSFQFAAGFDHRLSDWATFAADILGDVKMDDSVGFPEPLAFDPPVARSVRRANIPDTRDDVIDGSFGFKLRMQGGVILWTNALVSLNDGGMRDGVITSVGFQFSSR